MSSAISYPNDAHSEAASQVFGFLAEIEMPTFTNVNIRAEFINNQFQVMVPEALSDFYSGYGKSVGEALYKKLQINYTTIDNAKKHDLSYKFSTTKTNEWRDFIRAHCKSDMDAWFEFCSNYISHRVEKVWESTCDEVGVNFLSLRGSDAKDWMTGLAQNQPPIRYFVFHKPGPSWKAGVDFRQQPGVQIMCTIT